MKFSSLLHKVTHSYFCQVLLLAAAYYITAQLSLSLALQPEKTSPFFPAAGVALAAILIGGYRLWIGIFLGGLFLNIPNYINWLQAEGGLPAAIIIAIVITVGSTVQALVGAWLIRRVGAYPEPLEAPKTILSIVLLGGFVSCLIAATLAVLAISFTTDIPWQTTRVFKWFSWWIGDSIGVILMTPLLLLMIPPEKSVKFQRKWVAALGFVVLSLILISLVKYLDHLRKRDMEVSFNIQAAAAFAVLKDRADASETLLHTIKAKKTLFKEEAFVKNIILRIEDTKAKEGERLLYGKNSPNDTELQWSALLKVGKNTWKITFSPTSDFLSDQMLKVFRELLIMALLLSTMGSILLLVIMGRSDSVHRLVDERTEALVKSESALRESEETFRSALENAPIGMALIGPEGNWLKVNQALCDMLGYDKIVMLQNNFQSITYPDDLAADLEYIGKVIADEIKTYKLEKRFYHKNNKIVWTQINASLVRHANGDPNYFITQIQDTTEYHELERIKNEFISIVSHELRTPITSIRGSLGLITGAFSKDFPIKVKELIDIAHNNCERLTLLINDILDIDKIASGQMRFDMKEELLASVTLRAIKANQAYAQKFNVQIEMEAMDETLRVNLDSARYIQVLTNLLSNAAKFSPPGATIKLSSTCVGERARIFIKDNGPGIPEDFRHHIFGKFLQADASLACSKGGSGLGLHIAKQLVEKMGGSIGFDTETGKGTIFWVEFPIIGEKS